MQQQISLELVRKFDPRATSPLKRDRTLYYISKDILDFFLAAAALLVLAPVMLIIAVLIRLDSAGPVFFAQKRVGARRWHFNGYAYWRMQEFSCYKFRTMIANADPAIHQAYMQALINHNHEQMVALQGGENRVHKLIRDPRITRIGHFLRKYSLDELPQFWCVLRGDMSLVGPRPAIPYEVDQYRPWHRYRLQAKPGITGLQQVTARCTVDFDKQTRLDLEYIRKQSLGLDIKILLKTPLVVLKHDGAC